MYGEQRHYFKKEERITSNKRIEALFVYGKSFVAYPLRVVCLESDALVKAMAQVLVSVPKKRIKSAVKRNRLKRLIREAYRVNKHILNDVLEHKNRHVEIAFVYVKDELTDFETIERSMSKALNEIRNVLETDRGQC